MYRLLILIVLCLKVASPAPQAKESDVTYVKIQPLIEDTPLEAAASTRESRIEKLPLTIPGITSQKETDKIKNKPEFNQSEIVSIKKSVTENKTELTEITTSSAESKANLPEDKSDTENLDPSESIQFDTITDPNDAEESITTDDLSEVNPTDDLSLAHSDKLVDTVSSETSLTDRRGRYFDSIETTETIEDVTLKYEDELIDHTILEEPRTKPPPKFVPKTPKLSYYPKPKAFHSYSANHLDIVGKRKFRSRCSCQKIWNCPKLQISVPRCPNEYFLCCF